MTTTENVWPLGWFRYPAMDRTSFSSPVFKCARSVMADWVSRFRNVPSTPGIDSEEINSDENGSRQASARTSLRNKGDNRSDLDNPDPLSSTKPSVCIFFLFAHARIVDSESCSEFS